MVLFIKGKHKKPKIFFLVFGERKSNFKEDLKIYFRLSSKKQYFCKSKYETKKAHIKIRN